MSVDNDPEPNGAKGGPPSYPDAGALPDAPPVYPGEPREGPPPYPGGLRDDPPPYPGEPSESPPPYPRTVVTADTPPAYPGEPPDGPPRYPGEGPPPHPGETAPTHPSDPPPAYPPPASALPVFSGPPPTPLPSPSPPPAPAPPTTAGPTPPRPEPPAPPPEIRSPHDDLAFQSGRKHLKAYQRGVDRAAFSQLVVTLPMALVSVALVALVSAAFGPMLGWVAPVLWLLSGALVFVRPAEILIARRFLRMRQPDAQDAERLAAVWGEVTRRAGVRDDTYVLWIQERDELNATAVAGHIVGVTRHAMHRLPNSQLAAILAHELGHHVGGHTWARMLADWYALPARIAGRILGVAGLLVFMVCANVPVLAIAFGVALLVLLYTLAFTMGLWWLVLLLAAAPVCMSWLRTRAEYRADAFAAGLGFGAELTAVLAREQRSRPKRNDSAKSRGPHTDYAARLHHLRRVTAPA